MRITIEFFNRKIIFTTFNGSNKGLNPNEEDFNNRIKTLENIVKSKGFEKGLDPGDALLDRVRNLENRVKNIEDINRNNLNTFDDILGRLRVLEKDIKFFIVKKPGWSNEDIIDRIRYLEQANIENLRTFNDKFDKIDNKIQGIEDHELFLKYGKT